MTINAADTSSIISKVMQTIENEKKQYLQEGVSDVGNDTQHKEIINKLNEKHAVIMLNGKCLILNEVINPANDLPDVDFSTLPDFKAWYQNQKTTIVVREQKQEITIADYWLDHRDRREFSGLVFDPEQKTDPSYYNLWRGFAVTPQKGNWSKMEDHIFKNICSEDTELFQYLMAWMARIVQFPGGDRPGVVLVLKGKQGTGKGMLVNNFGKIFGQHYKHIISPHLLTGRFNDHLKDCLLMFVDESFWAGDKQGEGPLKGMITESHFHVEAKHKQAFLIKNHTNFIFASNNSWVVPADTEERRFFCIDVSDTKIKNSKYFGEIQTQMDNGGREAMLYSLLHLNITDFDFRNFPRREALLNQILHSWPSPKKFWFECLRNGSFGKQNYWPLEYPTADFYELFTTFSKVAGDRFLTQDKMFGKQIRELCPGIERKQKGNGERYYRFPSLNDCRTALESAVKIRINWNE